MTFACPFCGNSVVLRLAAVSQGESPEPLVEPQSPLVEPQLEPQTGQVEPQLATVEPQTGLNRNFAEDIALEALSLKTNTELKPKPIRQRRKFAYADDRFDAFWRAYPLRKGKAEAFSRWQQVMRAGVDAAVVIDAAKRYAGWCQAHPDRLVKYPEGWLNGGRWDDELDTPPAVGATDPAWIIGTDEYRARVESEEARIREAW